MSFWNNWLECMTHGQNIYQFFSVRIWVNENSRYKEIAAFILYTGPLYFKCGFWKLRSIGNIWQFSLASITLSFLSMLSHSFVFINWLILNFKGSRNIRKEFRPEIFRKMLIFISADYVHYSSVTVIDKSNFPSMFYTARKMKISTNGFFSKCDQIRRKLRIWSHLLKKSLMENSIFVQCYS